MRGVVKWFNTTKGYGFIAPDDGSKDVFVHVNDLKKVGLSELVEGQKVSFEVAEGKGDKKAAKNIVLV